MRNGPVCGGHSGLEGIEARGAAAGAGAESKGAGL